MTLVWSYLLSKFGLGKIIAIGGLFLASASVLGGVYLKGYYGCVSKYELAQRDATIADLNKQLADRADEVAFGNDLFEQFQRIESKNDEIEADLSQRPVSGCIDADWLRGLSTIE